MEFRIMEFNSETYTSLFGSIDYCYFSSDLKYPEGLLLFLGSYISKEYRGQGHYKEMVKALLNSFPENTVVQIPIENKILLPLFCRMGFVIVKEIEFWGCPQNCKVMQGVINKENINQI
jgi:hypothetical protein